MVVSDEIVVVQILPVSMKWRKKKEKLSWSIIGRHLEYYYPQYVAFLLHFTVLCSYFFHFVAVRSREAMNVRVTQIS